MAVEQAGEKGLFAFGVLPPVVRGALQLQPSAAGFLALAKAFQG